MTSKISPTSTQYTTLLHMSTTSQRDLLLSQNITFTHCVNNNSINSGTSEVEDGVYSVVKFGKCKEIII